MENILLIADIKNLNSSTLNFACYLANLTGSTICAFLQNPEAAVARQRSALLSIAGYDDQKPSLLESRLDSSRTNLTIFKSTLEKNGIEYKIYKEGDIINCSRYADVIITDAGTFQRKESEKAPGSFIKNLLKNAECPVLIAPENFTGVNRIIFAYDGSASSAFAIKQFTYLFPEFEDKNLTVFHVKNEFDLSAEDKKQFTRWLKNRYSAIGFETVEGSASEELCHFLSSRKKCLVVMGAYSRSALSQFFKPSHADELLRTADHPLFIAHR